MKRIAIVIVTIGILILGGVVISMHENNHKSQSNRSSATVTKSHTNHKGKTLVVYLSRTGHTQEVAQLIHREVGGDLLRLTTAKSYPKKYQDMLATAQSEQDANARPKLRGTLPNLDDYQTIFLGYPIWWNKNPMAINTFLNHYHSLEGKTIYPFTTSGSSGLGSSVSELKKNAPGAEFGKGLPITDDQMTRAPELVKNWVKEIGF